MRRSKIARIPAQHHIARHISGLVLRYGIGGQLRDPDAVGEDVLDLLQAQLAVEHRGFVDHAEILLAPVRTGLTRDHERQIVRIDVYVAHRWSFAFHLAIDVDAKRLVAEGAGDEVPFVVADHGRPVHQ